MIIVDTLLPVNPVRAIIDTEADIVATVDGGTLHRCLHSCGPLVRMLLLQLLIRLLCDDMIVIIMDAKS